METPRDLRRQSLFNQMNGVNCIPSSTPLRKSLLNSSLNSSINVNDDDERADRRNQVQIERRLSSISTPKAVSLTESFIKEQFTVYTNLFAENKINSKNAWNLQIIDMLEPLCQQHRKDVLQVASSALDISARVYGIRVDNVHSEGLKLASNMARVYKNTAPAENDDEEDGSGEEQEGAVETAKKKKKKKRKIISGVKSTIGKNPTSNLGKLPKLEPVDFTTRINADTGTIDNLLTNMLRESSNSFILMDCTKKLIEQVDSNVQSNTKILLSSMPLTMRIPIINVPLRDFRLDQWDPDQEDKQLNPEKSLLSEVQPVVFDKDGFPIAELDGSVCENFDNDGDMGLQDDDEMPLIGSALAPEFRGNIANIVDAGDKSVDTTQYSLHSIITGNNGHYIDRIWAGPSHWKLKCIRSATPRFTSQTIVKEAQKGTRKKLEPQKIDFWADEPEIDFTKVVKKKRPPTVEIHKITLPYMDQSCSRILTTIRELMLKPGVCPVEKKDKDKDPSEEQDYEVGPYNYDNQNDSLYCSQSQPNDNDDMDNEANDENIPFSPGNLADNLVDNPEMVPHTYINYALKAKQMDMKKLKKAIWKKIAVPKENNEKTLVPQKFSDLYKSLPEILQQKENQDLSCPLAFVALLHLCNEQNLCLKQLPGYKDFLITGE